MSDDNKNITGLKVPILWSRDNKSINATLLLVIYRNNPFLVPLPYTMSPTHIKDNHLVIDQELDDDLFNARPVADYCPVKQAWVKR